MTNVNNNETNNEVLVDNETQTDNKDTNNTNINTNVEENSTANASLTEEQIRKMIQSESDRIRTEYSKKLKDKEKELEQVKLENMSEQEKLDYENKTLQEQLEEREKALRDKEEAFNRSQLELQVIEILKEQSLPLEAKSFLIGTNIDTTTENINTFKTMFDKAVEVEISERIKGTKKEFKESYATGIMTKEQFQNLSYKERTKLIEVNPTLYKELSR